MPTPEWAADEDRLIDHMNRDHVDSLNAMCRRFVGIESTDAVMVSIDPEGFHVQCADCIHYLHFACLCRTSEEVRSEMVRLSRESQTASA